MAKPKSEIIKRPIESAGYNIKKSAYSSVLESFAILLLGILFIVWPDIMIQAVAYIIGGILLVKGCFEILNYFMDKSQIYSNLLLSGTVSALLGVVVLVLGPNIANVFRLVVGIFLIYEALVHLSTAIKLYYAKISFWQVIAIFALIILALGVFVTFNDAASIIGWVMVVAGLIGIISDVMFIGQVDKVVSALTGSIDQFNKKTSRQK